jgi:hypothetical protein
LQPCGGVVKQKGKTYWHVAKGVNWDLDDEQPKKGKPKVGKPRKPKTPQTAPKTPQTAPKSFQTYND